MDSETVIELKRVAKNYPHIMEILQRESEEIRPLRDESQEKYELAFQELIYRVWKNRWKGRQPVGKEELFWWLSLMMIAKFPESIILKNLKITDEADWERFCERVQQDKLDGFLPSQMTPKEYLAVIYDFPKLTIRPGHPYLRALGFKSTKEWLAKGGINHLVRMAKLIRIGQIQRVIKAVFWSLHRSFQIQGRAPERSTSFDDYGNRISVVDITAELDTEYSLEQVVSETKLSPLETIIVSAWRCGEIPLPGHKSKYGQVKSFCIENNIPYKDFYIIRDRAMAKLKQTGAKAR